MRLSGLRVAAGLAALLLTGTSVYAVGRISGRVEDSETNAIASVWVDAYDDATNLVDSGFTASDGIYEITNLPAGAYYLRTDVIGANFIDEWYDDIPATGAGVPGAATAVSVSDSVATTNIDFMLEQGGAISGQVTGTTTNALPLSNIWVDAHTPDGVRYGSALTGTNGMYSIPGLAADTYYVRTDSYGQNYADEWYENEAVLDGEIPQDALPVVVPAGWTTGGVDFALAVGASFSGNVSDSSTQGVSNIWVDAYTSDGAWIRSGITDANGDYAVVGLPADSFHARTFAGGLNYADEWYDDLTILGWDVDPGATPLFLTSGVMRVGIDFSLADGATVAGTVTTASGNPIPGTGVDIYTADSTWIGRGTTGTNGNYAIEGLPARVFYLRTEVGGLNYINEWYDDLAATDTLVPTSAAPVTATTGVTTASIDFSLSVGGVISGAVTDAGGAPLAGISADAFHAGDGTWIASGVTGPTGAYAIVGLQAGTYAVRTYATPANYADEWYDDVPVVGDLLPGNAATVPVTAGLTHSGVDFALADGATVEGLITDSAPAPIAGAVVELYHTNGTRVSEDTAAYDGTYAISALPEGTYYARIDVGTMNYIEEWYSNVVAVGTELDTKATPLAVTAGATLSDVNFVLEQGGSITGLVLRGDLTALGDMNIDVYTTGTNWFDSVQTSANGRYSVPGLPPGPYYVRTYAGGTLYVDEWFDDVWVVPDGVPAGVQAVAVTSSAPANSASFVLAQGAGMSGSVRDGGGSPIVGTGVDVFLVNGMRLAHGTTGNDGSYSLGRVPESTCYVRTDAGGTWFIDEWYDDVPLSGAGIDPAAAVLVVSNGTEWTSLDFVLAFPVVDAYTDAGLFSIYWQAASGTTHQVKRSTDLTAWSNAPSGSNANQQGYRPATTQGIMEYQDPEAPGSNHYYRIEVLP